MGASTEIRDWVTDLTPGDVFTLDNAQKACPSKSRDAIKMTLSRLCKGDDPLLGRARRGIYSRRELNARIPNELGPGVEPWLTWQIAGPGAGLAPPNAINLFGWSTQMVPKLNIVVVGRPPVPTEKSTRYFQRSNTLRRVLSREEVSLLEAASGFDVFSEMEWNEALAKLDSRIKWCKTEWGESAATMNTKLFREVSNNEPYRGKKFLRRCQEIADVYDQ